MEISWKWLNLCLGLLFFQLCNGFPINLEDSVADQHTQLLTGLVAVLLTVCSVVLLAGCLCCQRRNGFKEFRDSPVVASSTTNLDHGHVNPIANGEFTIFTPLSSSPYNNNVFLANERIITRTVEDFIYEDFDVSSWFNESEKDFPRIKLKYIKELGKGWFGKVVEGAAKEVPPNEQAWTPVAVRILEATASRKERVLFLNDAAIYRCGTHANILTLIGRCLDTVPLLLLQEYCPQGDLKSYLRSKKGNVEQLLSTDYPLLWCCQLTSALKHLHADGVTHPDLATRNCLLTSNLTLKVGDYGLSENKYPEDYYQGTPRVPVRWCSPESLTCTPTTIQPKKTTTESNIWSLGVTMWEICECGEQPYSVLSDDEVVSQVFGPPNIRLSRPSFPLLYTDYLYRLMQLCWTNAESRPTVSQIDLMLSDLWQVYKNTKISTLSADDFDKRWELFKPNLLLKDNIVDNAEIEESGTNITKPLSPSLNNLHGSLDNLLDSGDQMELWLENITKSDDLSLAKSNSNAILSLDDPLVSEISSSESSDRASPKQKKSKLKSKIDFDLNIKFRDSSIKHPYNFSDSALFSQRTSSESETEDENWRNKVERGAYTEKVRLKSRSVADLMILTHVDYSESESETPLPSLDYRVNYKNVRYAPKNNLENVSLTYGSEGNLLSVHDAFQEELKKLKEERRDSLLFVPDNHSQTSFNKLDNNNHNFPVEELTLSDSNLNNMSLIDSTSKRLMHELNRVAEIQPANQVFNVFSVTIDKFKPIRVNNCKLNDIINFSDIKPFTSAQNDKPEMLHEEWKEVAGTPVEESLLQANDSHVDRQKIGICDTSEKHISDVISETYPSALDDNNLQNQSNIADLYQLSKNDIANGDGIYQTNTQLDEKCATYLDMKPFVCNSESGIDSLHYEEASNNLHFPESGERDAVGTINPIFLNDILTSDLETELSSSNTGSNTEASTPGTVIHCDAFMDSIKPDWNAINNSNEKSDDNIQIAATSENQISSQIKEGDKVSESKLPQIFQYENLVVPKLSETVTETSKDFEELNVSDISNKNYNDYINITPRTADSNENSCNKFKELKTVQYEVSSGDNEMICINANKNETFAPKNFSEEDTKHKNLDDSKCLHDVIILGANEKLLCDPNTTVRVPKLSEIIKNKIFIPSTSGSEKSVPEVTGSKCHINNEFQKPPEDGTESKNFYEQGDLHITLEPSSKLHKEFHIEDGIDFNEVNVKVTEDSKVNNNFELLKGKDESLCEAKNIVLIPKLSEIIKNQQSDANPEISPKCHTTPADDFNESNDLNVLNVDAVKDSNCEQQENIANEDIIDLHDIVVDVNEMPKTEKDFCVPKEYQEELLCETRNDIQVPTLSEIIKNKFVPNESLPEEYNTYQINSDEKLFAERKCPESITDINVEDQVTLPEIKIIANQVDLNEPKTVGSTENSNNTPYEKIENNIVELNEISVDETPRKDNFQILKNDSEHNWRNVNTVENLNNKIFEEFEPKNDVDMNNPNNFDVCEALEGNDNFQVSQNKSDDHQIDAANTTENLNNETLETLKHNYLSETVVIDVNEVPEENNFLDIKRNETVTANSSQNLVCDKIVDVDEIILVNVNKTFKEENISQVSMKTEPNHNQINTITSADNSNYELYKQFEYKDPTNLNGLVLCLNEVSEKENNIHLTKENEVNDADSTQNSKCEFQEKSQNKIITDLNDLVHIDVIETPEKECNVQITNENEVNTANSIHSSCFKPREKSQNEIVDLNEIILLDINETVNNSQVQKPSGIVGSKQNNCESELNCLSRSDVKVKGDPIFNEDDVLILPKLHTIIPNKNISPEGSKSCHSDNNELTFNVENNESHVSDKKDVLESEKIYEVKDSERIGNNNTYLEDKISPTFDFNSDQEQVVPSSLNVYTSTPAARNKRHISPKETCLNINLFDAGTAKHDGKNLDFYTDQIPLDTSKELNYSLETWDNFLGKTLDAQKDIQNENLFDSFCSEPHSLLFVESGNDLVQPHECIEAKNANEDNQIVISKENNSNNISNANNGTFIIEAKNEKTFIKDDKESMNKNETFTLNKTEPLEYEAEDVVDNSAWGSSGGWFLHPQTSSKEPSGTIEVRENTGSYVGFGIDDEIMAAIRNELLNKLPHAQVAPSEKVTEVEEWDSSEKNEVFLKYNIYNPPLSPILEESYIEESEIISPRLESDNEDSEWSEPDMPETLPPEIESQSAHTYDSQLKGPHHRHTPSQDSCCSNDTLFNLEELTCAVGDVEKENDLIKNAVSEPETITQSELENNESNETTLEICVNVLKPQNMIPDNANEVSPKSETNNNVNGKNLNNTVVLESTNCNVEEIEYAEQEDDLEVFCNNPHFNVDDDYINVSETKNSEDTSYISEFISQEIEHTSKQFQKLSEASSSESNSSLEESPIAFKKTQVAPLPSPEDNPWKQLPASLLSYDKVISQNNTLLLPATESNDVVPEFSDLNKDKDMIESQCKNVDEFNEECVTKHEDNDAHHEINNRKIVQTVFENIKAEQPDYENIKPSESFYENVEDTPPVYENVKDDQPVYQNFNVPSDIYNEVDYVNVVNLENSKNNPDYLNDKTVDSDQDEHKTVSETNPDEDIYGMLTDIKFNGPSENQLISASFSESNDINDEQDWDSGSDTRSSSSGEFIWKEGEHEESLKALRAAPQDVLEDVKPMEGIAEESTDESDVSSTTSDEEGEAPEFVPSAWDKFATPTKSALRSPEKTLEKSEKNKSKGVWFKKQKYHCVYEYPREPESPVLQSQDLWKPQLDYSSFTDWEFDADTYFPSSVDDNDIFPSAYNYQPKTISSRNLYQLTSISDFVPSNTGLEDEFFVSSTARPFDVVGSLSSQFFPGSSSWNGENATPDSGVEDSTPGSSTEMNECNSNVKVTNSNSVQSLKKLASEAMKRSKQMSIKSNDALGGLRHTRNKLKLDLPPSPSAFTSTKMFTVEPTLEPVIREKPTFTTFGKSRFSVQHVDTPPDESKNKNVSFEALPYKPLKEESVQIDSQKESCQDIDQQDRFEQEKHILKDKFDCVKGHNEFIRGEASLLDSADEDSGIESSTLERKLSNNGLLQ